MGLLIVVTAVPTGRSGATTPDLVFTFDPEEYPYPPNSLFEGRHKFKKHYYKVVGDMKANGEEFQCAQLLTTIPKSNGG